MLKKLLLAGSLLLLTSPFLFAQNALVEGHVLVKLKPQVTPEAFIATFATQTRAGGGVWIEKLLSKRGNIHLLQYDTSSVSSTILILELLANPEIEAASFDYRVEDRTLPDDPGLLDQWGIMTIHADEVWELTTGGLTQQGDSIVVAVLDSGFDIYHEDIYDNVWRNHGEIPGDGIDNDENGYVDDYFGWNFVDDSPEHISDAHGHSVAGIIGARGNNGTGVTGINWNIKLMVMEARTVSEIIAAYEYIIDQRERYNQSNGQEGAFVVATNASFGINKLHCDNQPLWGEMYDKLGAAGILTAAGTANNSWDVDAEGDMPTTCPSEYLMTVLNTNQFDERYIGSAYGNLSIDMGAPGQNSFTTKPFDQYGIFNGNSAAAPHLAGSIALMYSLPCAGLGNSALQYPEQTARRIRDALYEGVDPVEQLVGITATGGRLNAAKAMDILLKSCESNTGGLTTLHIYPNPADQQLQIAYELPALEAFDLQIFNSLGQQVFAQKMEPSIFENKPVELPVSNWRPGLYIAYIRQEGEVVSRKFVIQHH